MLLWGAYVEYPLPTECGTCAIATGISEKMGGPHVKDSLTPWTQTTPQTLSHVCPFCNKLHNSRNSLMNHIRFYDQMVLVCPICGGCRSNQWRTVIGHIKKCATARLNITSRKVEPGEPHWKRSDPLLMNHTRAPKTEATFTLPVWPDPPDDEESVHRGQIFGHILKEWGAQVATIKKAAAAEAKEEADKVEDAAPDKDDDKLTSLKLRQPVCHSKKKKKELPNKTEPLNDNLDDYFSPSQSQNSQETADITPVNTPQKSGEAKSKNNTDWSSHRRVDKSSEPLLEPISQDSEVPNLSKTSKSSQGSA